MSASSKTTTIRVDAAGELELILRGLLEEHRRLLDAVDGKRDALRVADLARIAELCEEERRIIGRVQQLEALRRALLDRIAGTVGRTRGAEVTVRDITGRLAEATRGRIEALAAQLRDLVETVKQSSAVVREAAETLNRHLAGIVNTIHHALGRHTVYTASGNVDPGTAVALQVDVKS